MGGGDLIQQSRVRVIVGFLRYQIGPQCPRVGQRQSKAQTGLFRRFIQAGQDEGVPDLGIKRKGLAVSPRGGAVAQAVGGQTRQMDRQPSIALG